MISPYGSDRKLFFMRQALKQAQKSFFRGEVPIGAVVVDAQGTIIGRGYNQVEQKHSQTAHAEMIALRNAGKQLGDWRLSGCWLFVTLEPCAMCMKCIQLSRCAGVFYGARSPLFGYQMVDKEGVFQIYKENVVEIVSGLCAEDAAALLKLFFRERRKEKKRDRREEE